MRVMMFGELAALGAALSWTFQQSCIGKRWKRQSQYRRTLCVWLYKAILIVLVFAVGKFWVLMSLPLEAVVMACISGIIGLGFGDTLHMKSLKLVGVARTVPVTCTYPLFNLLWATLLANETITVPIVVGAFAIVFGIWLLSRKRKRRRGSPRKEDAGHRRSFRSFNSNYLVNKHNND